MPVTIGEFEVVSEPAGTPQPVAAPAAPTAAEPDPLTVLRIAQQLQEQALRLWAH